MRTGRMIMKNKFRKTCVENVVPISGHSFRVEGLRKKTENLSLDDPAE
jgi:hypothetical protein